MQLPGISGRVFILRQTSASMGTPEGSKTRGFEVFDSALPSKQASWRVNSTFKKSHGYI